MFINNDWEEVLQQKYSKACERYSNVDLKFYDKIYNSNP